MSSFIEMVLKVILGVSTGFFLVVALYTAGPDIETHLAPVVGKLEILTVNALSEGRAEIYVRFDKLRRCKYLGTAWYRGNRNTPGFERVSFEFLRRPGDRPNSTRPVGEQVAGPWIIYMPAEEIRGNSFVELFHECHALWQTRTEFYP